MLPGKYRIENELLSLVMAPTALREYSNNNRAIRILAESIVLSEVFLADDLH